MKTVELNIHDLILTQQGIDDVLFKYNEATLVFGNGDRITFKVEGPMGAKLLIEAEINVKMVEEVDYSYKEFHESEEELKKGQLDPEY